MDKKATVIEWQEAAANDCCKPPLSRFVLLTDAQSFCVVAAKDWCQGLSANCEEDTAG